MAAAFALALAGCEGGTGFSFASPDIGRDSGRIATQEVQLNDGMRVRAPFGKCVDTDRVRQSGGAATVVIANCSNLGARADVGAREAAIVLVTVLPGQHGSIPALRDMVRSNPGLLARSGSNEDVELVAVKTSSAALYANLIDGSPGTPAGVSARHWKAALDVAGRAVIISVFGKADGPLPGKAGEALIRDAAQAMLESNAETPLPGAGVVPTGASTVEDAVVETDPAPLGVNPAGWLRRALGRS